eukprot:TRINITY_DN14904_c0_g1_i1.p1 TRINITY_DN14904_c0_g1~~TRINITY_DN14904_c0_g1_i1.p1  ORF type:complete len:407 (+),score=201.01 TRINITY_DN14904_c0_g1_i1:3-1223(+)
MRQQMSQMDGLLRSQAPLMLPEKINTDSFVDPASKLVVPRWVPEPEKQAILSMSQQRRKAMRRHQIISIKACLGALEGTMRSPSEADLSEPTGDQTKQWVQREWTKINLMKAATPPAAALQGQWVYGRRTDGDLSEYEFANLEGKMRYTERTASGGTLQGAVLSADEGPTPPEETQFRPVWCVVLDDDKGKMWFRVIDGVTIESLFVHDKTAAKGFKASARRGWSSLSGAPETADIMFADGLQADAESGLVVPPWAPEMALKQMKMLPLTERKRMKTMQDMPVRQALGLAEDAPVTAEQTKSWMMQKYTEHLQQQQQMAGMTPAQKMEFMQKQMQGQQEAMAKLKMEAGGPEAAPEVAAPPPPQTAEEADIQSQLAVINRMVMQNMQVENQSKKSEAQGPAGPSLD